MLFDFLSNYTNVWIVNAILVTALIWMGVRVYRANRKVGQDMSLAYTVGYAAADAAASLTPYRSQLEPRIPQISTEKLSLLILVLWDQHASVDEIAETLGLETDAVILELCRIGKLPGEVVDFDFRHPSGIDKEFDSDAALVEAATPEPDGKLESAIAEFEHPSGLTFEQWREGITLRDLVPREDRHHSKTRRLESPLQLVRYDSAGYMD